MVTICMENNGYILLPRLSPDSPQTQRGWDTKDVVVAILKTLKKGLEGEKTISSY